MRRHLDQGLRVSLPDQDVDGEPREDGRVGHHVGEALQVEESVVVSGRATTTVLFLNPATGVAGQLGDLGVLPRKLWTLVSMIVPVRGRADWAWPGPRQS